MVKFTTTAAKEGDDLNASANGDEEMSIYPNPNHGAFVVELKLADDATTEADIQIINALGQNIYLNRTAIVNGELFEEVKLDETVPGGTYFVRVIVGDKVYTGKILYQK